MMDQPSNVIFSAGRFSPSSPSHRLVRENIVTIVTIVILSQYQCVAGDDPLFDIVTHIVTHNPLISLDGDAGDAGDDLFGSKREALRNATKKGGRARPARGR
jgi:hypothetical protein